MNTRSLVSSGLKDSPTESATLSPLERFFRHFSQLKLADQLSLIFASVLGLTLSLILSPLILVIGLWQMGARFMGK